MPKKFSLMMDKFNERQDPSKRRENNESVIHNTKKCHGFEVNFFKLVNLLVVLITFLELLNNFQTLMFSIVFVT